ncbi:MAG: putative coenzyme F420-dependent oxidoreductase [Actinomycetia bacterium]|nr:putative coenzyme F420-dependent oxidoreductase [Actinomycetes bacterium]
MTGGQGLRQFQQFTELCAEVGFSGLVVTESGRTPFLQCAAAALTGVDIDLATGVSVAFARSPMVHAVTAWELADATGGRFRLGLGPQVRAHVVRRYGVEFDPPGPRMKEYVLAVRACFAAFRGDAPLNFEGKYYNLSLLPAMWNPGPLSVPDPPLDLAAVNPWMLRTAGEVADGVHVHPMNSITYLEETLLPNLAVGRERAGRAAEDFTLFVPLFTVGGDTPEDRAAMRESTRGMVAFYGSTPNYAFIFEQLGRPGTTEALRAAQKSGDLAGMAAIIDDDLLEHFIIEGTWAELPGKVKTRVAPLAGYDVRVVLYLAGGARGARFRQFGTLARDLANVTP